MNATQLLVHFDRLAEAPNAVPRLRRFILDLAVRGKLVAQDAGDEPAAELLMRIRAEKSKLVHGRLLRFEKELPPITETEMRLVLPPGWAWARLGSLSHLVTSGSRDWAKYYSDDGPIFVRMGNLSRDSYRLRMSNVQRVTPPSDGEGKRTSLQGGDILISITGEVGLLGLVPADFGEAYINQHTCMVRPSRELPSRFLPELFRSSFAQDQFNAPQRGLKNSFRLTDVTEFVVPLPPLVEQHRIVAKVDELMALCDQLEAAQQERERRRDRLAVASLQRLNQPAADTTPEAQREYARFHLHHLPRLTTEPEHVKAMRQTIRNWAIAGQITRQDTNDEPASELLTKNLHWRAAAIERKKIRDPRKELLAIGGDNSPHVLPKQWSWARLGEVIYIQSGDGLTAANMKDGSIPVFGGNGANGHHDAFNIDKPTLVIGRVGYYCGSIHITPDRAWVTDNAFVTHFCPDLFSLRFLALLLATTNLKENEGATAQPVISGSKIYPLIVGIPPLAEQHRIVAKVDELMALCDQLEAQLTTTQTDSRRLLEAVLEDALAPM